MGRPGLNDRSREKYNAAVHNDLVNIPKAVPASIPGKKVSAQSYSAVGHDTVGPALYNPKIELQHHRAPIQNFHLSKYQRKVFEPTNEIRNNIPSRENPGPAHYDSIGKIPAKQFNAAGTTSNFLSKVPNCQNVKVIHKDNPGPG